MNSPKKLLIVRTDRIGDVILSLPMAEFVKQKYPECEVAYFLRKYTSPLLDSNPFIDEVIVADESDGEILFTENLKKIKARGFDTCVVVNPTLRISLMMLLAGIKSRIGTGYRWYSFMFNEKVFEHRKYAEKHELEYNINLLSKIGIDAIDYSKEIKFNLSVSNKDSEKVIELLQGKGIKPTDKLVIVHPGSGGSSVDLPKEYLKPPENGNNKPKLTTLNLAAEEHILSIMKTVGNSVQRAAPLLGVSERTLQRRLKAIRERRN